ncbi:MAG: NAD(P)-dependent oxidoreductase [Gammaproteobacteria bacterium]|nr:NAD(P)-dependent oxidoreductase [Gammaproteobacteria bacterium]MDH5310740.1 NAD(P)-dependent oxidoreductase [Gammaproteobacteria bacterium]
MAKIAFLGAGMMGQPMIRNLLRAGHTVVVYNRTVDKARELEKFGARVAATPKLAATGATVIWSSVTNDAASAAVWAGDDGALEADLAPGAFAIESSTVSPDWVLHLRDLAVARGLRFLDCPVAGRPDVAEAGQLKVFAGGSAVDVDAIRPILAGVSKGVMHLGVVGSGITFKLIYNVMGAIQVAACAEGMFACEAAGIDISVAAEGFSAGATGSPHVVRHARYMAEGVHEDPVQFSGRMRIKDFDYGIQLIESVGAQSVIGHAARSVFAQMVEHDMGDHNDSELIDTLRRAHRRNGK